MSHRRAKRERQGKGGVIIRAPFTPDQVESINACQQTDGPWHPLTCGNDDCPRPWHYDTKGIPVYQEESVLIATRSGLRCPRCNYRQEYAYRGMGDWSWVQILAAMQGGAA